MAPRLDIDELEFAAAISRLTKQLGEAGARPELGSDFNRFAALAASSKRDTKVTPHFDPAINTFTHANAFWIALFKEESSRCIGMAAFRFDQTGGQTLAEFICDHWARLYAPDSSSEIDLRPSDQWHFLADVHGGCAYGGDAWIDPKFRDRGLASVFSRVAIIVAMMRWRFDHVYAFVTADMLERGLGKKYGYNHEYDLAVSWRSPASQVSEDWALCHSSWNDCVHMVRTTADANWLARSGQPRKSSLRHKSEGSGGSKSRKRDKARTDG